MVQALDGVEDVLEGDAVGQDAHVGLELAHGRLGVGAVQAVDLAAQEAQHVEDHLQVAHIGTAEVRQAQIEGAVAQTVRLVDQLDPGGIVNLGAGGQALLAAEEAHSAAGGGAEGACRSSSALMA